MKNRKLLLSQLDTKLQALESLKKVHKPTTGWINAIRTSLGMSLEQLANKLGITRQSAFSLERRESEGGITLKALAEVARAMDMEFVYGFVPKDGSLEALVDRKSTELATAIVLRASGTMKLEDQENPNERIQNAIAERAATFKRELPKILWD